MTGQEWLAQKKADALKNPITVTARKKTKHANVTEFSDGSVIIDCRTDRNAKPL